MNRLKALWGKRIGGVPVPVIFVVLVVLAWIVIRRRQARQASDVQPDPAGVDANTPVGAMMGDGSGSTGYDAPQPYPGGSSSDGPWWQGTPIWNDNAGDTTAAGGPVGSTGTPAKKVPPKKKGHHSAHKAGHHTPAKKAAHPHAAKAPAKKTTAHQAKKTAAKMANPRAPHRPTKAQAAHMKATHPRKQQRPRRRSQP